MGPQRARLSPWPPLWRSRPSSRARAPRRGDRSAIFTTAVLRRSTSPRPLPRGSRPAPGWDGDVLLSDVNFAFDPLQRKPALLAPGEGGAMLLLDEAHQLHSRVRGMYRQTLAAGALRSALAEAPAGPWQRPLKALGARLERLPDAQKAGGSGSSGGALSALLDQALQACASRPFLAPASFARRTAPLSSPAAGRGTPRRLGRPRPRARSPLRSCLRRRC